MSGPESFLVFGGMRDEGAWLVEWVSWQRMLGFDILIAVNDCTDHSPQLLQAFAEAGWLTWFAHRPRPGQPPKASAHAAMMGRPERQAADWMLICDVDEFLVLHRGDGTVRSFLDDLGRDHLGVAFHWRCFGNSGWDRYQDGLVHRQFQRCGPNGMRPNIMVKTLTRTPRRFGAFSDHGPWKFEGEMGAGRNVIVDSAGRVIERFSTGPHPVRYTSPEEIEHSGGQMNHYVVRSDEHWAMKKGTASASAGKDRYTEQFHRARNRNGRRDASALAYRDRFDRIHAEAVALPGVARLHHLCCADYVARLCASRGADPAEDPRWQDHMAEAAALSA
ncbi:glycosyltransferase family 2 protein [Wenxinia saemankumensis]|uniref:Glycosyl transferase family 2 n=1 Tax=Wenxinia saemankumensis TaxID=1447782 RepID=A0A1M6C7I1_9RHOB|nr:glycosyltransferase family 2 protein [Wenxinia saemankumensis]SHI56658.1 Glycosyl transferase family 2 [Wenxinia saemankumensis]